MGEAIGSGRLEAFDFDAGLSIEGIMFKCQEEQCAVLGICVDPPVMAGRSAELDFHSVHSARRAIELMRMASFDFVLVGLRLPDQSTWDFLRHLKVAYPQTKWALVGGPITEQQEVTARMFGATTLFDATPTSNELLNLTERMRERAIANVLSGKFDRSLSATGAKRSAVG
jgi:DNA-binding NtrC family response regulator